MRWSWSRRRSRGLLGRPSSVRPVGGRRRRAWRLPSVLGRAQGTKLRSRSSMVRWSQLGRSIRRGILDGRDGTSTLCFDMGFKSVRRVPMGFTCSAVHVPARRSCLSLRPFKICSSSIRVRSSSSLLWRSSISATRRRKSLTSSEPSSTTVSAMTGTRKGPPRFEEQRSPTDQSVFSIR